MAKKLVSPPTPPNNPDPVRKIHPGMSNHVMLNPEFTGVARSVECFNNQGHNNFRILTLHIEKGVVKMMDVSDAYANFEAISRLEYWNELSVMHLNNTWMNGKTLIK